MTFLTEPEPPRGAPLPAAAGVERVVAPNPGPMTYWGTNTWLIQGEDGVTVLDPGPDDATHVAAVLAAAGGTVRRILLSHGHHDHRGAVAALREATGAPVHAWAGGAAVPDVPLADGAAVAGLVALHTPGHAADHLCFARADGVLFSADHVMGWSTSVVSPPDGSMADYLASLRRLLARDDALFLPGHGPPVPSPRRLVRHLLDHRLAREAAILGALGPSPTDTAALVARTYPGLAPALRRAAERSVLAHLLKLETDGLAARDAEGWRAATPGARTGS